MYGKASKSNKSNEIDSTSDDYSVWSNMKMRLMAEPVWKCFINLVGQYFAAYDNVTGCQCMTKFKYV